VPRRLSCPQLIARDHELGQLRSALARAAGGTPQTLFVVGEAGVGKTRLVHEFAERARDEGARVWTGNCLPLPDGYLPYAPILDILRAVAVDVGATRLGELAGPSAERLASLMPELASTRSRFDDSMGQPESGQLRLHAELRFLLERLTDEPTVLVVEDLHWADTSTQGLLSVLIRGLRRGHMLLVCTYRDDELPPASPLRALLAELSRGGTDLITLTRLDQTATSAQLAGILHAQPDPALAERIFVRSGGNPFLVEELINARPDADRLPETLRDILLIRVRRLSPTALRVLQAVALAGRGAGHSLLESVVGLEPGDLIAAVSEAAEQYLLVPDADRYTFRHALVAEAVLTDIVPGERIRLHRAIADALTTRLPSEHAGATVTASALASAHAEVAYHWFAARDLGRALLASIDAGLAAERAFALPEARSQFDRAIRLWREAPSARELAQLDLVDLYRRAAEMAYMIGDGAEALTLVHRAIDAADARRNPLRVGILHERLGRYLLANASSEASTIAAYETAVRLVPETPSGERARVLCGLAAVLMMAGRHAESRLLAEQALHVAREVGARRAEAHALCTLGTDLVSLGDVENGLALQREALAIAGQFDNPEDLCRLYANLSDRLRTAGRFAEAAEIALRGVELAERYGTADTFGNFVLGNALEALFWLGRWDEIDNRLGDGPIDTGNAVQKTNPWCAIASLRTVQGRFDEAQLYVDAVRRAIAAGGHSELRGYAHVIVAELYLWSREPQAAADAVRQALDVLADTGHIPLMARLLSAGGRAEADLNRRAGPASGGLPVDSGLAAIVMAIGDRAAAMPYASAHLAVAEAELARSRGDDAEPEAWGRAAVHWGRLDGPYLVGYSRWRQAEAILRTGGRRRAAARALSEAYPIAARLGAAPLLGEVEALSRRARIDLIIDGGTRQVTPEHQAALSLTRREEEVLQLLGDGCTNRQIARTLFISEKTVSIHVSHVLAKLAVPNRAAAAAAAHQLGLLGTAAGGEPPS